MINYIKFLIVALMHRPLLFFVIWSVWLTLEYWVLGTSSYLRVHDNANTHVPLIMVGSVDWPASLGRLIQQWLSGIDLIANFGWWSTICLPFVFLPPWLAHGFVTFIQRFVAGYFTTRLMQDCLGTRRSIAYVAGMVYSLAHTDLGEVCLMHMLNEPGLPLLLWAFCRLPLHLPLRASLYAVFWGIGLGWSMAGLIGIYFLVPAAFLFTWLARSDVRSYKACWRLLAYFGLFTIVALIRQIPETWALLVHAGETYRGQSFGLRSTSANWPQFWRDRLNFASHWWPFILLTLTWISASRLKSREGKSIGLLLFIGLIFGPLMAPLKFYVAPYIGFLRGVDFTRFHMVSALALTMAAVSALAYLPAWKFTLKNGRDQEVGIVTMTHLACAFVALIALFWSVSVKQDHLTKIIKLKQNWHALYEHPDLGRLAGEAAPDGYRFATAGAYYNLHPGFWLPYGVDMADGHSPMYSARYYRYWTSVIRPLINLDPAIDGFHKWGSYVYLHHPRTGSEYESPVIPFTRWYNLDLLSLAGVRYVLSDKEVADERLLPLDLPGQEKAIATWDSMSRNQRMLAYVTGKPPVRRLLAYENEAALPRLFLAGGFEVFEDEASLVAGLESATIEEMSRRVYVTKDDMPGKPVVLDGANAGAVKMVLNEGGHLVVEVDLPASRILVCTNQHYRWWKWRIDGQELDMFPAYGAFMAAVVPAGKHRVELTYEPPYAKLLDLF